ncbi:MAG: DUF4837 family protein [Capnocytophaga sp.]|nr:DUF4837 family protein [Capnocytophaga sp.]
MKQLISIFIGLCLFVACKNSSNEDKNKDIYLPQSNGQINSLAVVIDNTLWKSAVGDTIRKYFASPVEGLSTEEPIFSLHQIPPQIFTGNTRNSRNILIIEKDSVNNVTIKENLFAQPQKISVIRGRTNRDITCEIQENFAKIVKIFKDHDIVESQMRFQQSLNKENDIEKTLGFKLTMPSVYKIVKKENNFFWIERQIKGGTTNLIIYEMPLNSIPDGDGRSESIVQMRDSIGKRYIPGREEGMYMITESAFAPSVYNTVIKERKTIESKGLWEVKNFLLGGPFINYIIEDKPNNRFVVIEGFVSAPMTDKRDYLFELESIIKSITFIK